jgi:hypothetical protein
LYVLAEAKGRWEAWVVASEEILVPASAGTGDGGSVGVIELVGGIIDDTK